MYQNIHDSLFRQHKALQLLGELLEEEYGNLLRRDTNDIVALEFSIQELIRQIAVEKTEVMRELGDMKVLDYVSTLPEEQGAALNRLFLMVDDAEQIMSRQASRNAQFSLALLDQSSRNLLALTSQVVPRKMDTYDRRGDMGRYSGRPQAALISGRL